MIDAVQYRKLLEAIHGIGMHLSEEALIKIALIIDDECTRLLKESEEYENE
jgi:hypothetical protein